MNRIPQIPLDWTPFLDRAKAPFPLSIVIVYNDMHAALRAAHMVERLGRKFAGKMQPRLQPLPLRQLADAGGYDHALSDAAAADMIIISSNGSGTLPAILKQWMQDYTAQKREGDTVVVALLSSREETDAPDSPRLQFLKKTAERGGLDFFAPRDLEEGASAVFNTFEVAG